MNAPLDASLARDYVLFVFFGAMGLLQVAAAYSRLRGLMLFPRPWICYSFGVAALAGAMVWFFGTEGRNVPGSVGGVEGSQQFYLFALGAVLALAATAILASLLRWAANGERTPRFRGLMALRDRTYFQAIAGNLRWKGLPRGRSRRSRLSLDKWASR